MKYLYAFLFVAVLSSGCSKDFLKRYDKRIIGTWDLFDVDNRGIGGGTGNLPFRDGTFVFSDEGRLTYTNRAGQIYKGDWDINRLNSRDNETIRLLSIHAVDFTTQEFRSEQFENIRFTGTNRFNAYIYSGSHTYVFRFRRQ